MSNCPLNVAKLIFSWRCFFAAVFNSAFLMPYVGSQLAQAQEVNQSCQISAAEAQEKDKLRLSALKGEQEAQNRYQQMLRQNAQTLQECRSRNWPQVQAIWLRLYPCDTQAGEIERIMDRIVNRGYNQVYLEAFYDGQVLLPAANNPTAWPSVIRTPGAENNDLLLKAIQKGQERGLKVYAWMFTTNFGYTYAQRQDREGAIARNGKGQTSLYVVEDGSQVFIDPYNLQAKSDYYQMVQEIMRRRPDGVLFDYVRYPRQAGSDSIATKVTDLWLYSEGTQQALFQRAQNNKGLELIRRFLSKGYVTAGDIGEVDKLYPQEGEPMWQGRMPPVAQTPAPGQAQAASTGQKPPTQQKAIIPPQQRQPQLQSELWQLSVAHAMQGILDFVNLAAYPAQQLGIPAGVVFFPDGNQTVGQGYDSRLQPWDRFPSSLEWHPMSYASCGNVSCIAAQVQQVLSQAKPGTQVIPAIAGQWGKSINGRPPLEAQMQAMRPFASQLRGVSHFAYSWQDPEHDNERKFCRAQ
ncbi:family 10 glycosylhydrolase [Fischerella sp. PCC 9605]|uniref:family 10 glycosylhydrolase n=1 Tax=Fischerella sp. PCC 9605 TaxID=1173024 RepID=UPI00047ECE10|nr:family 10 glycosylhydrolase [Fischerella sp. PCC 9605]